MDVCAAEDGEEAFTTAMVTSAAHVIRQLCTDKPDEGKVTFLLRHDPSTGYLWPGSCQQLQVLRTLPACAQLLKILAGSTPCGIDCRLVHQPYWPAFMYMLSVSSRHHVPYFCALNFLQAFCA